MNPFKNQYREDIEKQQREEAPKKMPDPRECEPRPFGAAQTAGALAGALMDADVSPEALQRETLPHIHSDEKLLQHIFSYHTPRPEQLEKYAALREAAKHFARVVLLTLPPGADRSAALRKIREAVMTANAGIALDGISF